MFLRGGFFSSGEGMLTIGAGSTVGGGSTVNWSNSIVTPQLVRESWVKAGLTDADGPDFDNHLAAVMDRMSCNEDVSTQNEVHLRIIDAANIVEIDGEYQAPKPVSRTRREVKVTGDTGKPYVVVLDGTHTSCNCTGFQFRKTCKHIGLARTAA
jgi:hypothetical protein